MDVQFQALFLFGLFGWTLAQQVYCPGDLASIPCSTTAATVWQGSALSGQCTMNVIIFQGLTQDNINDTFVCGEFTATVTNVEVTMGSITVTRLSSSLSFNITTSLDGTNVICSDGVNEIENIQLSVPVIPTPSLTSSQISLTSVTVNLTVDNNHCATMYFVEISQNGGPAITMSSPTPVFNVPDLDLCSYRYTAVCFTQASSGVQGMRSSPFLIPVDLSGLQGVTNVTEIGLQGVDNVTSTLSILEWDQLPNTQSQCITHYTLSWPDGGEYVTPDTTTSVSAMTHNAAGFPYCQTLPVTVTPQTLVGPVTGGSGSTGVMYQHPDFARPVATASFAVQSDEIFTITIEWQDISTEAVSTRMYGFIKDGEGTCVPEFTADQSVNSVSRTVSDAQPGDRYDFCVLFVNNECMATDSGSAEVPARLITSPSTASVGDNGFSISVNLPETPPMDPNILAILTTISPPHQLPLVADYPSSSRDYTATFTGLSAGTSYNYDIRIVLRSDTSTVVGLPVTGSFTVPVLIWPWVVAVIVIIIGVAVIVVFCGIVWYWCCKKRDKSVSEGPVYEDPDDFKPDPQTAGNAAYGHVQPHHGRERQNIRSQPTSQPTELTSMSGPVYEEPVDFKSDPYTAGNVAYGHVQPLHSRQ